MKKIYVYSILLNMLCLLTNATENQSTYIITLPNISTVHDARNALLSLQNPFTKELKKEYLKNSITGNVTLDKGMFQLFIYEQFIEAQPLQITKEKMYDYFLYRMSKYAYQTITTIFASRQSVHHTHPSNDMILDLGILQAWKQLYEDLQWFCIGGNRKLLSPIAVFNYGFLNSLLTDYARKKNRINYQNFLLILTKHILKKSGNGSAHNNFLNTATPLLWCYSGLQPSKNTVTIKKTQTNTKNQNQFIVPIVQKNNSLGLIPLILAIIKRYCIVGIGYCPVSLHAGHYNEITDAVVHDILHYNLQMVVFDNKKFFFEDVLNVLPVLINEYTSARSQDIENSLHKCFLLLFTIIHELTLEKATYHKNNTIRTAMIDFFTVPKNTPLDELASSDMLFNLTEMYMLYKTIYPSLTKLALTNNVFVNHNNMFERVDDTKKPITYRHVMPICNGLIYCLADSWNIFVRIYGDLIKSPLFATDNIVLLAKKLNINQSDFI